MATIIPPGYQALTDDNGNVLTDDAGETLYVYSGISIIVSSGFFRGSLHAIPSNPQDDNLYRDD